MRKAAYKRVAWINDAFLQLQKHVHQWDSGIVDHALSSNTVTGSAREKENVISLEEESTESNRRRTDPFMVGYETKNQV